MGRKTQGYFVMAALVVLLIILAIAFAVIDSSDGLVTSQQSQGEGGGAFPWLVFIPVAGGLFIPFIARKQQSLKLQGRKYAGRRFALLLAAATIVFLVSVSYIVLRVYRRL